MFYFLKEKFNTHFRKRNEKPFYYEISSLHKIGNNFRKRQSKANNNFNKEQKGGSEISKLRRHRMPTGITSNQRRMSVISDPVSDKDCYVVEIKNADSIHDNIFIIRILKKSNSNVSKQRSSKRITEEHMYKTILEDAIPVEKKIERTSQDSIFQENTNNSYDHSNTEFKNLAKQKDKTVNLQLKKVIGFKEKLFTNIVSIRISLLSFIFLFIALITIICMVLTWFIYFDLVLEINQYLNSTILITNLHHDIWTANAVAYRFKASIALYGNVSSDQLTLGKIMVV